MIYVSQGHEKGIGLEIFLKSFLCLDKNFQDQFILYTFEATLIKTLKSINFTYSLEGEQLYFYNAHLKLKLLSDVDLSESNSSLLSILKVIGKDDQLVTLPTSKDQLAFNGKACNGHTELFREYYSNNSITMNFIANNFNCMLLTDHISVNEIENTLTEDYIIDKCVITLNEINKFKNINEVIFSGINPHNGENGLISNKDSVLDNVIKKLSDKYKELSIHGPYPADTIHLKGFKDNKLFIYASHDQGLAPFKLYNGLIGVNLSLGMPFIRTSVDHGTAFDLYGKNSANYLSMLFLLKSIKKAQN